MKISFFWLEYKIDSELGFSMTELSRIAENTRKEEFSSSYLLQHHSRKAPTHTTTDAYSSLQTFEAWSW